MERRKLAIAGVVALLIVGGVAALVVVNPAAGDTSRPDEAKGHAYVDLDGGQLGDDERVLVKFNDKWWWVNKTTEELELIGDDVK